MTPTMALADTVRDLLERGSPLIGAHVGVVLRHVERGEEVAIDAATPVPLASVVKVPILVEAFSRLADGRIRLNDRWTLTAHWKNVGSGILGDLDDGLALTVHDLLTLMIVVSDNTATDMLFERFGVASINERMRALGLTEIHVVHTLRELFDDMLPSGDPDQDRSELARWQAHHGVRRTGYSFSPGPDNNVGTPRALARLMEMILRAELLDRAACDAMLAILLRQHYRERFPRFLPAGTKVAHKTGSLSGISNDVGLLYLPDGTHVAFALLATWDADAVRGDPRAETAAVTRLWDLFGAIGEATFRYFTNQA